MALGAFVQITATLHLDNEDLLSVLGLEQKGRVQKFIDSECIRLMKPYTPNLNGVLIDSATNLTEIGSGLIQQSTPYARYQYYGKLMVDPKTLKGSFYDPKTGRHWSRPGVKKIMDPSGRDLNYNVAKSPLAGPRWFERMAFDKKDQIASGAEKIAGEGK